MGSTDGSLTGRVSRYFGEHDTVRFVKEWCAAHGYHIEQAAAVGDSRSDVPLFERVGCAIALNATPDARREADHVIDTTTCARCCRCSFAARSVPKRRS